MRQKKDDATYIDEFGNTMEMGVTSYPHTVDVTVAMNPATGEYRLVMTFTDEKGTVTSQVLPLKLITEFYDGLGELIQGMKDIGAL